MATTKSKKENAKYNKPRYRASEKTKEKGQKKKKGGASTQKTTGRL